MLRAIFICAAIGIAAPALAQKRSRPESGLTYERDVRPILKANCFACHGEGEKLKAGLDLRLRRLIVQGGQSGSAIVPGQRDKSLLYQRIRKQEMPPGERKLTGDEVALIGRWIAEGARTAQSEPTEIGSGYYFTSEERSFWAFQPVGRPEMPKVKQPDRVRTPIDAFLLARLEEMNLSFSPEVEKHTLIRRAFFDLLGLPPTPEDVTRFLTDDAPDAYERLIDRLLASPHYGERWGRHWLDVAGYADSEGYSNDDPVRKFAYKYRDYCIQSLNVDKPFDQFIQEQLAGDEMAGPPYDNLSPDRVEKLVATGFLRMAPDGTGSRGVVKALASNQVIAETIKIVSTSLLGLSVGCAQCHNHRYDPIPQTDYYRMRAIFEPAYDPKNWRPPHERLVSLYTDADRKKAQEIEIEAAKIDKQRLEKQREYIERTFEKELSKLPEPLREPIRIARGTPASKRTPEQKKLLKEHPSVNVTSGSLYLYDRKAADDLKKYAARAAEIRSTKPVEEFVRASSEVPGNVPTTYLFHRGDHEQPKQALTPAGLTVLDTLPLRRLPVNDGDLSTSGRRLAYARRLTDGTHPLTARVLVNRVWMHHFGRGIVATPADFGALGDRPTHPELLDWLADEFMASGWRLKRLHKLIMTSTAYRQTSQRTSLLEEVDPDNQLLGRMTVRRLEAEAIRDSVLAISGKLNLQRFGPPVPVMADEVGQFVIGIENLNAGRPQGAIAMHGQEFRRSIYVQARRSRPLSLLATFDSPRMDPNCEARTSSTVAPQALMLMNSEFIVTQARHLAQRVREEAGSDVARQIAHAWTLVFAARPHDTETQEAVAFVAQQAEHFRATPPTDDSKNKDGKSKPAAGQLDSQQLALASFCHALLSANEFLYVD